jgi:putative ABC transport system permease protein
MISSYFKVALRNIKKHLFYTLINVTGLSIGIACTILITLFIIDELSYDRFNENGERIYRVINHIKFGGNDTWYAVSPSPMAKALVDEIPEIETAARFRTWGTFLVKKDKDNTKEYHGAWADPEIFNVFTIPLIRGDKNSALRDPNTMVISESLAKKYFGDNDPVNQMLILNNDMNYKVTGVYKDIQRNSHFHFTMMLAMAGLDESRNQVWLSNNFQTYFVLRKDADARVTERKINEMFIKNAGPQVLQFLGKSIEELEKQGTKVEQFLQPLYSIHLHSNVQVEFEANGDIKYVYIFSAVALFILILAVVNFTNLATARSAERAKEVGIRKVMGSFRSYLIRQFLMEAVIISLIAVLFAVVLANLVNPAFNLLAGKSTELPNISPVFWLTIISGGIIIGLIAGAYPAFFLSSYKPISVLSGKITRGSKGGLIRSILVIFQFTISIILITGTIAVYNQLNFIQHKKLGFNKDQVIIVDDAYVLGNQAESFRNEVLRDPDFISGSSSGFLPVSNSDRNNTTFWKKGERTSENSVNMQAWNIDFDYIKTFGMKIVDGRDFSRDFPGDSGAIILNQRAAKLYGFENPIGQEIQTFGETTDNSINIKNIKTYKVIGVVENFNFETLHESIGSLCMRLIPNSDKISFRYNTEKTDKVINILESRWKDFATGQPFQYSFLDEDFGNMYTAEKRTGRIFTSFAILAIIIASLGLFALAAFTAEQRTKEIGVRKVMGATIGNIVVLLSSHFSKLILIAFLIALPVAWYGLHLWLQSFAYKEVPGIMVYLSAGIISMLIAWATVGYQSFKAATANPSQALRNE